jgi:hypothetical protein
MSHCIAPVTPREEVDPRDDFDSDVTMIHDREELFVSMGWYSSERPPDEDEDEKKRAADPKIAPNPRE